MPSVRPIPPSRHRSQNRAEAALETWKQGIDRLAGDSIKLRLANANFEMVVSLSEQTIEQVRSAGMRLFMPDILRFKGQALAELGHLEQAASALAEAKEIAEAIGSRRALWPILLTWSELRSAQGDQTEADALMREARSTLDYMIKHLSAPDLRSSFFEQPLVRRTLEG